MKNYTILRGISLFADLDDDAVRALADRAVIREWEADARIVNQSDDIRAFYVIVSGRVKIFRSNAEGREQILYIIEAGQPFCFCTAFSDVPSPVSVTALEQSVVADIPAPAMEDLARQKPMLLLKIMQTLAGRLLEAMNMVESLSLYGIRERVASFLLHEETVSSEEPGRAFTLSISHREMAKILATTPETLSRTIQKFRKDRLIEASGRTIRILDREGLLSGR